MIEIPIQQLQRDGESEFHFTGSQKDLGLGRIEFPLRDLEIYLRLHDADHGYYLAGELYGIAKLECHRCLTQLPYSLDLKLQTLIVLDDSDDFDGQDEVIHIDASDQTLDLTGFIHDMILLDLPVKILCREGCQGLCAQCGTNLNKSTCDCHTEVIDPRWEKLKELNFEE